MYIIKWIFILVIFHTGLCQEIDGNYLNNFNLLNELGNPLVFMKTIIQQSGNDISRYVADAVTEILDDEVKNDTSELCLNHTKLFIEAVRRQENWALKMIDAFGKPRPGIMEYNLNMMGNYDECIAIQADRYADPDTKKGLDHPYTGKYCTGHVPLAGDQLSAFGQLEATVGICLPDTCSDKDGTLLLNIVAAKLFQNATSPAGYMTCQERSLELTDKALAASIVGAFFAAIILLATTYDVIIQHFLQRKSNKCEKDDKSVINGINNASFTVIKDDSFNSNTCKYILSENISTGEKPKHKLGIPGKLLLSFSVYSNAPKILNTNQPKGTLTCVNGIRFLSMTWVMLGHTFGYLTSNTDNLTTYLVSMSKRFTFQAIMNATVSVDTFFVLSGLLVSYLSLREMKKRGGALKFNWFLFYFHRYWRLTPPYMLLMLLYVSTFKYWTNGPVWPQSGVEIDECKDTWWTNMLYINNLYKADKQCMGWSWYLANDMQFYVISPLMLVPLFYSPIAGSVACLAFILVTFISAGIISSLNQFPPNIMFAKDIQEISDKLYQTPWTRIGPYVIGFLLGYILYKTECKVKMTKLVNMVGWTVATGMAISVLYGLYTPDATPPDLSNSVSALYNATSRTAWGLSVAWVIFACATGYGGFVNTLLSWRGIIPLSRLTYCAYLVHPIVMSLYVYSRKTTTYLYDLEIIYQFLGHLCVSYAAAFVLSLAFESPMMGLEKVLLWRKKNS